MGLTRVEETELIAVLFQKVIQILARLAKLLPFQSRSVLVSCLTFLTSSGGGQIQEPHWRILLA